MNNKTSSIFAVLVVIFAFLFLYFEQLVFADNILGIAIQICAAALMLWARLTFGLRSFHAAANTTNGGLVTNGPYRYFRHPIYAALIYFFVGSLVAFPYIETLAGFALIVIGLSARMYFEEKFLLAEYKNEYIAYQKQTKRIIPFVF